MARNFPDSVPNDHIVTALGGLGFTGALTEAAIVRPTTDRTQGIFQATPSTGGASRIALRLGAAGELIARIGSTTVTAPTLTLTAANGWGLVALSRAAGTSTPRWHRFIASTNAWAHENHGATAADFTAPITEAYLGRDPSIDVFLGDIEMIGVWNANFSDAQVEALPYALRNWFHPLQKAIWRLNQASIATKVVDLTGNGANESAITGTAVSTVSVPFFGSGLPIILVERTYAVTHLMAAAAAGTGAVSAAAGSPHILKALVALVTGSSSVTVNAAAPRVTHPLQATVTGVGIVTAPLMAEYGLAASVVGTSSVTSSIGSFQFLLAVVTGTSSVSATLPVARRLQATATGTSTVTAGTVKLVGMAAAPAGTSSVTATIRSLTGMRAVVTGTGAVSANMKAKLVFVAVVTGRATVSAQVRLHIDPLFTVHVPGLLTSGVHTGDSLVLTPHVDDSLVLTPDDLSEG